MSRNDRDADALRADRRTILSLAGAGLLTATLAGCGKEAKAAEKSLAERDDAETLTWRAARKRLEEGNLRFAEGRSAHPDQSAGRRKRLGSEGQKPYAAVLACADSRVPPEVVFDQGLGDLFVVRSAGQVVDSVVLGTLQFGVVEFGMPLIVVLGHSNCGAVKATIEALEKRSAAAGTDVDHLLSAITPAVEEAVELGSTGEDLLPVAIDSNVERVQQQLSRAKLLNLAVKSRKLRILGAVYELGTGEVSFL